MTRPHACHNLSAVPEPDPILQALRDFADRVTRKASQITTGEPEDQLRAPFERFMEDIAQAGALRLVCTGETPLPGRMGTPDFAVHASDLLAGYVELKAPGKGADPRRFKGHDNEQWKRFQAIPNLLYTDGNEWGLYRSGKRERRIARLSGQVATDGKKAVTDENAEDVWAILADFLSWQPTIPRRASGKVDLENFARTLAPLCRLLREDVEEALQQPDSSLIQLAGDWRQLLFPDATDEQFVDAYAQTVTFALLLARSEGADPLNLPNAQSALAADHTVLSLALEILTHRNAFREISASVKLLIRVIGQVPPKALRRPSDAWLLRYEDSLPLTAAEDPWLFFYEVFLTAYDPKLRKDAGAYYTPVEVAFAQVRLVDDILRNRLNKSLGFADPDVVTLDPAVGTGTYLIAVIDHALARVHREHGRGAVSGKARKLAKNLYGFENMAGPFAVSELRVTRVLQDWGGKLEETNILFTDTLESPHAHPPQMGLLYKDITDQHKRALHVKENVPVIVCLGNPPYDRHPPADEVGTARAGGWVRFGDEVEGERPIFEDFREPATEAGHGVHVHNLYNLYVYFWRWALWKVFEHETTTGPGVVSYISAASYLDGDAFCGMREHMRRVCDEIWILDLGGEGRGTRRDDNVFAIQTPVAIAIAARYGEPNRDTPAAVYYARIQGDRAAKLNALGAVRDFSAVEWHDSPQDWLAPFRPAGSGAYFDWPLLTDLLPWRQCGVKAGRTWVIGPDADTLKKRWQALLNAGGSQRSTLFKDSATGRQAHHQVNQLPPAAGKLKAISKLSRSARPASIIRYAYRSLDRQYVFADARVLDRPSPDLWAAYSDQQVHLTTLLNHPLGGGPATTVASEIPDLHHFRGSYGAKEVLPLFRDGQAKDANVLPRLLDLLARECGEAVAPEDFLAYVYGILAQPSFTERFAEQLGTRELRVPLTKDAGLFQKVRDAGAKLLWLHTYGERFIPQGHHRGHVPVGKAQCSQGVPGDKDNYPEDYHYDDGAEILFVGTGKFEPVSPEVYEFEVSGLKVVQSWLGYRMKEPKGKKSSPLNEINPETWPSEFTTELLELLWVLEHTLAEYPRQAKLLEAVVKGPVFTAAELPPVPDWARKAPSREATPRLIEEDAHNEED